MMSAFLRSLAFSAAFSLESAFFTLAALLCLPLPANATIALARAWSCVSLAVFARIGGIRYEVEGLGNIPEGRCVIFASKHQSMWETVAYQYIFGNCVFMFKREILLFFPPFGLEMLRAGNIMVSRGSTTKKGLERLLEKFRRTLSRHNIIVFPEGTRTKPGAPPAYKSGLAIIASGVPDAVIVPVAMDSGLYWPKRAFVKRRGTIKVRVMPAIEAYGVPKVELLARIEDAIESGMREIGR
ncbi:MAG: 1-acyl-sn-glycerol-3-phosphate acyltransferase [Rickettsiales bacterium]|jgi:1-acyl-sn-glycerol-3-phosphate acyltransferase|nr:1-acyl-sn-glycerol-3-phosphate acyltransferase [Rickettsiales bacterium]